MRMKNYEWSGRFIDSDDQDILTKICWPRYANRVHMSRFALSLHAFVQLISNCHQGGTSWSSPPFLILTLILFQIKYAVSGIGFLDFLSPERFQRTIHRPCFHLTKDQARLARNFKLHIKNVSDVYWFSQICAPRKDANKSSFEDYNILTGNINIFLETLSNFIILYWRPCLIWANCHWLVSLLPIINF